MHEKQLYAFRSETLYVEEYIRMFNSRVLNLVAPQPVFTIDDFLDIFVKSDDEQFVLRNATKFGEFRCARTVRNFPTDSRITYIWDHPSIAAPVRTDFVSEPDSRLISVQVWADQYINTKNEYDKLLELFKYLNTHCRTPAQVKFYWPSLFNIISSMGGYRGKEITKTVLDITTRTIPALPNNIRLLCKQVAASVATAQLMGVFEHKDTQEQKDPNRLEFLICG